LIRGSSKDLAHVDLGNDLVRDMRRKMWRRGSAIARHGAVTEASPRPISWVIRVEWPTIESNAGAIAASLDKPLSAVMTPLAQAHERTEPEFVDIAPMWLDVITDLRRHDNASLQAILAKRMREQLVPPDPRPAP
jgi:hypothetical protein